MKQYFRLFWMRMFRWNIISHLKHPEVVQKVLMEVQEKHLVMEGIEVILREISERTIREEGINNAVICQYTT